jgi:RhoGAP domain/C2 domain
MAAQRPSKSPPTSVVVVSSSSSKSCSSQLFSRDRVYSVRLEVLRGSDLAIKDTACASSDPYCIVTCRNKKYKTRVQRKNLNPEWSDAKFELGAFNFRRGQEEDNDDELVVSVWDYDRGIARDDFMGQIVFSLGSAFACEAACQRGGVERWLELAPRSRHDSKNISGKLLVKVKMRPIQLLLEGWLEKKGKSRRNWLRRYMLLRSVAALGDRDDDDDEEATATSWEIAYFADAKKAAESQALESAAAAGKSGGISYRTLTKRGSEPLGVMRLDGGALEVVDSSSAPAAGSSSDDSGSKFSFVIHTRAAGSPAAPDAGASAAGVSACGAEDGAVGRRRPSALLSLPRVRKVRSRSSPSAVDASSPSLSSLQSSSPSGTPRGRAYGCRAEDEATFIEWIRVLERLIPPYVPPAGAASSSSSKPPKRPKGRVFETPLERIMAAQRRAGFAEKVPLHLLEVIAYIRSGSHLDCEGIFRKSGSSYVIDQKVTVANSGHRIDWERVDIHVACGFLKRWLRDMAEPLLTYELFDRFVACVTAANESSATPSRSIAAMRAVVNELAADNAEVLRELLELCADIVGHEEHNRMSPKNCSIVFSPNLIWPRGRRPEDLLAALEPTTELVSRLICHHRAVLYDEAPPSTLAAAKLMAVGSSRITLPSANESAADAATAEARALFADYDADGNESLDTHEFWSFFTEIIQSEVTTPALKRYLIERGVMPSLREIDKDGNGEVSLPEFLSFYLKHNQ